MASAAAWVFQTKMALFISSLLLTLFRFFSKIFLVSFRHDKSSPMNNSCCSSPPPSGEINEISKIDGDDSKFDDVGDGDASKPNFVFKFEFQTKELLSRINEGNNANGDSALLEEYEFLAEKFNQMKAAKNVSCFMEEAKAASFNVEEAPQDFGHGECEKDESREMKLVTGEEPRSDGEKLGSHENDSASDSDYDYVGYETDCFEDEGEDMKKEIRETKELQKNDHHNPEEKPTEALWEHQELIEQLKMEFKRVRADALPTVPEDYEFLNLDDLKPRKVDEILHGRIGEFDEFYKSYSVRMRNFDILNNQKLNALRLLQSKKPPKPFSSRKSFCSQNLLRCKSNKDYDFFDPISVKFRELHSELEVVYVGQLCLSWEFLKWQYGKALELWKSPYKTATYNEVAGEFQKFKEYLQRFVEGECSEERTRVENYVSNRYKMSLLLQVPVVRGDSLKDRRKTRRKGRDDGEIISSDDLVEKLEESITTMWQFIRADKYASSSINASQKRRREHLQETDLNLLAEVQTDLHKKNMKLKEILKSRNSMLKRFRKHEEEEGTDDHLYFFSEVDMKLVSKVLNMSSVTTDQLEWCRDMLSKICFVNRKLCVDPSVLLFPC
ncbi:hypothetical protein C1H46_016950 [Malus baccata]|uniref:Ribosomal protein L34Ae n=1 Tax=Malus baccata TaxID=106549 RepID=A0A540MF60_MALBA|nr:hypothetical protein C1H46_016950 [Malus baccata]